MSTLTLRTSLRHNFSTRVSQRITARHSLTAYKQHMMPTYRRAPYLDRLDRQLKRVARYVETRGAEGIPNLVISMPRRYGKTLSVGQMFCSWYLGRNPTHRIILAAYGASLVHQTSRRARAMVRRHEWRRLFGHQLADDSRSVSAWDLADTDGGLDAMGIRAAATGKGFHLLVVDDPIKNREEAESELIRQRVWDELNDSFFSGANVPYAARVIIGTRWHLDDPIGRILSMPDGDWHQFTLPALAVEGDMLGREPGEPLDEYRHTHAQLERLRETLPLTSWQSLWQQDPIESQGGFFQRDWFRVVSDPPDMEYAVRYWDLAMSDKPTADFTCGVKLGRGVDGHYYILDVVRRRVDWGQLVDFLAEVMLADGDHVPQGIEQAGYMTRAVQDLNLDPRLHGYGIQGYAVDKAKHIRALPVQGKFSANVLSLKHGHWNGAYIDELCAFTPRGAMYDDQVDATSGAWAMIDDMDIGWGQVSWQN